MMIFQRKQIFILSLILMVVVAGYLQYSYNKSSISLGSGDGKLKKDGAVYVDNISNNLNNQSKSEVKKEVVQDTLKKDILKQVDGTQTDVKQDTSKQYSKQANDFFAKAKLDKEINRGKNKDAIKEILSNSNASKDLKDSVNEKIAKLVSNSEKEMKIETLVRERGFSDVFALLGDDGSLDVVVKSSDLTSTQVAQIADIASRQASVPINNVHVKNIS